ncbi:hypothetical protein C8R43DRAFT_957104 [Mycena crocata]|nr:hypothetical protein C8R43DRAFT_957104 [Mycena crocata]
MLIDYPDKRINPAAANYKNGRPVEPRIVQPEHFKEREARAHTRFVYRRGFDVDFIARINCVPESAVTSALFNREGDDLDGDEKYIYDDFLQHFPDLMGGSKNKAKRWHTPTLPLLAAVSQDDLPDLGTATLTQFGHSVHSLLQDYVEPYRRGPVGAGKQSAADDRGIVPTVCPTPSCNDFVRGIPAPMALRPSFKFDDEGRAVCRRVYMHPNYETFTQISTIFGSTHGPVRKAIKNLYSPPDDTSKDDEILTDEFKVAFPGIQKNNTKRGKKRTNQELMSERPDKATVNRSRQSDLPEVPSGPIVVERDSVAVTQFLKDIEAFDLSEWAGLLAEKGMCTLADLSKYGRMGEDRRVKLFKRLFLPTIPEAHVLLICDEVGKLGEKV